jgi:hypothetical protein
MSQPEGFAVQHRGLIYEIDNVGGTAVRNPRGSTLSLMASRYRQVCMLGGICNKVTLVNKAAVVLALAMILSACSPGDAGSAGLTIDRNGDLVAVVESCGKNIKDVRIRNVDDPVISYGRWSSVSTPLVALS